MSSFTSSNSHSRRAPGRRRGPSRTAARPLPRAEAPTPIAFEAAAHDPTPVDFSTLGLDPRIERALADHQFVRTTPVQSAVFPAVLSGIDLVGCAETGTGKTAAFLLPILQRLLTARDAAANGGAKGNGHAASRPQATRVLILAPTRELALQIEEDFQGLAYHTPLGGVAVYGGVPAGPQDRGLRARADVVVATPGRLLDHMNSGAADFRSLEVLVLDEADRMLDMGFWPDVRRIVSTLPTERQTLLFSATMSDDVTRSAAQIMRDPKVIQIGRTGGLATTITHTAHVMPSTEKIAWLAEFLRRAHEPTIVFVRTKRWADRLARRLATANVRCATLHADRSMSQRTAAVEGFRSGRHKVLVATDIAARGLDIERIGYVVNYEVPGIVDTYVHRVGRTGRAEAAGNAVTLASPEEIPALRALEKALKLTLVDKATSATTANGSTATASTAATAAASHASAAHPHDGSNGRVSKDAEGRRRRRRSPRRASGAGSGSGDSIQVLGPAQKEIAVDQRG